LIKYSLNGHKSIRFLGGDVTLASAVKVLLSDCIKDAILRWLIDNWGYEGERLRHLTL
jgi:hypothetical protein